MHFRSFAPFSVLAFAASVFAVPVPVASDSLAARVDDVALSMPMKRVAAAENPTTAPPSPTFQQIFENASTNMAPILKSLRASVANKGKVDEQLVKKNLKAIIAGLTSLQAELQRFAKNPSSLVLSLSTVARIVTTFGTFLQLLFTVLGALTSVVATTPLGPVISPLIYDIGSLVGTILAVLVSVEPVLMQGLRPTLASLIPIFEFLNLNSVLSLKSILSHIPL